jgi:galactokinase
VSAQKSKDSVHILSEKFVQLYGTSSMSVQAPGRVNLIGEHTDYNDGFVLPAAIPFHTNVAIARRSDRRLVIYSDNYSERIEVDLEDLPTKARQHWSDYVIGVAAKLEEHGTALLGANLLIQGDIPQGAGLGSSASLEVAVCRALLEVSAATMDGTEMARLCQRAEDEFVGARCGIMDQFVSVHGQKDHALLLDCRSLSYHLQPIPEDVRLVICNTMVRHSLASGEYNQRRSDCEAAARFFAGHRANVTALRDVTVADLECYGSDLPETVRKRCRHVITENDRALRAADSLTHQDLSSFGQMMWDSHASLRDDYEVSCRELDLMVELAAKRDGVYGARMMGGGFGGCTINLMQRDRVEEFQLKVAEGYELAVGRRPEIYVFTADDGVKCNTDHALVAEKADSMKRSDTGTR